MGEACGAEGASEADAGKEGGARTSTAVDTVHSMCSTLRVEDGMTAATTAKSTSTRRQPVLRHAAHAGVRVVELVRACERQRTATRVGLTAAAPIIATLVGVS